MIVMLNNLHLNLYHTKTSISANADGRKIDHIALSTEYSYQETSVGR